LSIFFLTYLAKLLFAWRTGIENGWQDELGWQKTALSNSFLETAINYDAGYPTPLLRALSYVLANISPASFVVWHLVVLLIISACVASLAFSKIVSTDSSLIIAGVVSAYPSFDLLLLHNLSYWVFIPLFVVSTNLLHSTNEVREKQKKRGGYSTFMFSLVILAAKPQILIATFILSICAILKQRELNARLIIVPTTILCLLFAGRVSDNPLNLALDIASIYNFLLTILSHFVVVSAPLVILAVFAFSRLITFELVALYLLTANFLVGRIVFSRYKLVIQFRLIQGIFLAFISYTFSLYFFPNSAWSQNNLLTSEVYTSLFSRHYLPIILSVSFLIILAFREHRYSRILLFMAFVQSSIMQIALFSKFYAPV
jgi:hypothetical protein